MISIIFHTLIYVLCIGTSILLIISEGEILELKENARFEKREEETGGCQNKREIIWIGGNL